MEEFEIYKALGDPTRLELVKRLTKSQPLTLGELTKDLGISRQGARKQVQVLMDSGVVSTHAQGRETMVYLEVEALYKARDFITKLEKQWEKRLLALKSFVESD